MDALQQTLSELTQSGSGTNSNMNAIINDYVKYHLARFSICGVLIVVLILFSIFLWKRFRKTPLKAQRKWSFEKTVYAAFGILNILILLFLVVIVAANMINAFYPSHGFGLLIQDVSKAKGSMYSDEIRNAFNNWLKSGSGSFPPIIETQIHEIVKSHAIIASVCGALCALLTVFSVYFWRLLIKKSIANDSRCKLTWRKRATFVFGSTVGTVSVGGSLVMMAMFVTNLLRTVAPLTVFLNNLM